MTEFQLYNWLDPGLKKQKETDIWIDKDGFKQSSGLDWKRVETF